MRYAVYLVAVLAAAGLVYVISQPPQPTAPEVASPAEAPAQPDAAAPAVAENVVAENAERVTLNVPEMHCPVACYPAVKKTLEQQPGVVAVDLSKQQQEGIIDNPQVLIQTADGFDAQAAIDSLSQAGFEKSSVIQ